MAGTQTWQKLLGRQEGKQQQFQPTHNLWQNENANNFQQFRFSFFERLKMKKPGMVQKNKHKQKYLTLGARNFPGTKEWAVCSFEISFSEVSLFYVTSRNQHI